MYLIHHSSVLMKQYECLRTLVGDTLCWRYLKQGELKYNLVKLHGWLHLLSLKILKREYHDSPFFTEAEGLFLCPQEPTTRLHPELV